MLHSIVCAGLMGSAVLGVDQDAMFGQPLPAGAALLAFQQVGFLEVFSLRSDAEWTPYATDETLYDWIVRVNADQGMPTGDFWEVARLPNSEMDSISESVFDSEFVDIRHFVIWGYLDGGAGAVRVVALIEESVYQGQADEDYTVRLFQAVDYPLTDSEAGEMMRDRVVRRPSSGGAGGGCQGLADGKGRGMVSRIRSSDCQGEQQSFPEVINSDGRAGDRKVPGRAKEARDRNGRDIQASTNAAGIACLAANNSCTDNCDMTEVASLIGCENTRIAVLGGAGATCLTLGAMNPGAGIFCSGAALIFSSWQTYHCRGDAGDQNNVCNNGCRSVFAACCAQAGTSCGAR